MLNPKDISTWTTSDITSWLKNIKMTQYISKFEQNKINGYDLIYLTKEDLKNLGIVNIHDKNVILNSMKSALLQQLKLNINYKNKSAIIQLDFDPNFTVEQLCKNFKLIFKSENELFLVVNNNEILMPNLKIIDLILYEPNIYKNFKIISDNEINYSNNNNTYNNINNNTYNNINNNIYNNKILAKTPNKNVYKNLYNSELENEYKIEKEINNNNILNKTMINNNYTKNIKSLDNLEIMYNNSKKYPKINNNKNGNINTGEYYMNYKAYEDYNKIKELKTDINKNNNNLYEYNNIKNMKNIETYRKNYSIKNGELNLDINNINLNRIKNGEEDEQKFSSEKRNYRLKELNLNRNYGNNLSNNNFNYNLNNENEINDELNNYNNGNKTFNERINYNNNINNIDINSNYQ